MAGRRHAARLVGERGIDPCGHFAARRRQAAAVALSSRAEQRLALDVGAQHAPRPARARASGASARASTDLPVPDSPPIATSTAAGGAISAARQLEIVPRAVARSRRDRRCRPLAAAPPSPWRGSRRASRGRTAAPRARRDPPSRRRLDEIAVEHDVGGCAQPALDQVHQQEGEIVEHVAGRDQRAELDGVEQHRRAVDQRDIAEMQVAVAAPDETARCRARAAADGCAQARRGWPRPARSPAAAGTARGSRRTPRRSARYRRASASIQGAVRPRRAGAWARRHDAAEAVGQRGVDARRHPRDGRASAPRRSGASRPPIRPARPARRARACRPRRA